MVKVKHKLGGRLEMMDEKYAKILVSLGKVQIINIVEQKKVIEEVQVMQQKPEVIEKSDKPVSKRNTVKPKEPK